MTKAERGTKARTRLIRGFVAIGVSAATLLLILSGIAEPWPNLRFFYIGCAAVAGWGLTDIVRAKA